MNNPRRSSSEPEPTPLSEIIPTLFRDIVNDFDIHDVEDKLRSLFDKNNLDYITKQPNNDHKALHLIWTLQKMPDSKIKQFLDIINPYYDWIVEQIYSEANLQSYDTINYLGTLKSMQSRNYKHTKYNVHRTEQFLELRSALRSLNPPNSYHSVVLLGGLGSGKKWLAIDVCSDFGVLKSMKFKIFWIDCSECNSQEEDYKTQKKLMIQLNPEHQFDNGGYTHTNFLRLREQLKQQLKQKDNNECLLVLANVQNTKCLEAFNLDCKRLIITRNRKVSESLPPRINKHLELKNGLTLNEFYLLLDNYKNSDYDWRVDSLALANDIYHMSLGEPCSLSIIAKHISKKKSNWIDCMKNINKFEISDKKLLQDIEKSLEILNDKELQLFAIFAIFPRCAQIPVKLLAYLWNLQLSEAEDIISKLDNYFFVRKLLLEDQETIVCCVKFMYSSYLNHCSEIKKLINPLVLHTRIVKYYHVEEQLNNRKDVDFDVDSYDGYFFRWIGYHLSNSADKQLLPKLYTDFGFLDQMMRAVGLNDTIADLHNYRVEIANGDINFSLRNLEHFLAKLEEKIKYYPDCCLLQYALFCKKDFILELALKQIEKFPHRLWFSERGQYQQWRFIFSLTQTAKLLRILDNDLCIVVLANNDVVLIDLSLGSSCSQVPLVKSNPIVDIQIIDNNNHILILDCYGFLKLWDITEEKRRIINQRSSKTSFKQCFFYKAHTIFNKQIINNYLNSCKKIQTFSVETGVQDTYCTILVTLSNGFLTFFDWNPTIKEFKESTEIPHDVKIKKIHNICLINKTHYMIIYYTEDDKMDVIFIKRRNTQQETINFDLPENENLVYRKAYDNFVLMIFTHTVIRLKLTFHPVFNGTMEVLYKSHDCVINCGKLLLENQYLMLGTQRGIRVFDIANRTETLQSVVSENISTMDNYDLDDDEYKSMIVCGCSNKNILYIFGLRLANGQTLVWEHSSEHKASDELAPLEQSGARFIGNTLFDICEENNILYAVDSNNRIHQICRNDTQNWSILPPLDVKHNIIGIKCVKNYLIVVFENGAIYDYREKRLLVELNEILHKELFLKAVDDNILVISGSIDSTYVQHLAIKHEKKHIQFLTKYCKMLMHNKLLIVTNFGAAVIFDCESSFNIPGSRYDIYIIINASNHLACCDLKDDVLFLGFSQYAVHIYTLEKNTDGIIVCKKRSEILPDNSINISCLAASNNAKLLAIGIGAVASGGLRSPGDIEIFKLNDDYKPQLIYCLKSHVRPINDLRFSPHNEVLVSVAEQICFWNINSVLNNPLDVGNKKRHSSRFTSQKSTEEVDFKAICQQQRRDNFLNLDHNFLSSIEVLSNKVDQHNNTMEQSVSSDDLSDKSVFDTSVDKNDNSIWTGLTGSCDKPELLSCLKLDGNEAKQIFTGKNFTQFSTIDDEGVYYCLERIKTALPETTTEDDMDITDSFSSSINLDYTDVHRLSRASSTMSGADVVDTADS